MAPPQKNSPDENGPPYGFARQMVTITITKQIGLVAQVVGAITAHGLRVCYSDCCKGVLSDG